MSANSYLSNFKRGVSLTDAILSAIRATQTIHDLDLLMDSTCREMGFRYFALIHHADLRETSPGQIDLKRYPDAVSERIIDQRNWRRDPVLRACAFAGRAFQWSELGDIIRLRRFDCESLSFGASHGLNEGITIPFSALGECTGSCTFAGTAHPEQARCMLGMAQFIGVFAFQAAKRLFSAPSYGLTVKSRLHPRPRDCVILAGRGFSNKEIARALALTPRTVDGYLTEARRLFDAHDRTELVVAALLAGEVGLHEIRSRQPE